VRDAERAEKWRGVMSFPLLTVMREAPIWLFTPLFTSVFV
jgi:hypothetical protein